MEWIHIFIFQQLPFLLYMKLGILSSGFNHCSGQKPLGVATRATTEICNLRYSRPCTYSLCLVPSGKLPLSTRSFFYFDAGVPLYITAAYRSTETFKLFCLFVENLVGSYTLYAELSSFLLPINVESYFHNISDAGVRKRNWARHSALMRTDGRERRKEFNCLKTPLPSRRRCFFFF